MGELAVRTTSRGFQKGVREACPGGAGALRTGPETATHEEGSYKEGVLGELPGDICEPGPCITG